MLLVAIHVILAVFQSNAVSVSSSCLSEREALLAFRERVTSNGGELLKSWTLSANMSSWEGVHLGGHGQVVELHLQEMRLQGELYPLWNALPSLQVLNLSHNSLNGVFNVTSSSPLCSSTSLTTIDLSFNELSGTLLDGIRQFQHLEKLILDHNGLSGEPPQGLFQLRSLRALDMSCNNFTGELSSGFGLLHDMQYLNLSHNNFSGTLPTSALSRLPALHKLDVSSNSLSELEASSSGFQGLHTLDLSSNRLSGNFGSFLDTAITLQVLNLSRNAFTGALPWLARGSTVRVLDLDFNNFTGDMNNIVGMVYLEHLSVANNNLSGPIPNELGESLTNLITFDICSNNIHGSIPESLVNLRRLRELKLSNNRLNSMPDLGMSLPSSLEVLSAGNNMFSGPLRMSYTATLAASKLEVLYLPHNQFTGRIPQGLGLLRNLKKLMLNDNGFEGSIPPSLVGCELLEEMWMNNNHLTGGIPVEIFKLSRLRMLVLANNSLSGSPVPRGISQCKALEVLWLEQNNFSGLISSEVGQLPSLLMLSLASNNLTGQIPSSIGNLDKLVGLDLGSNALSGPIPNELAGLSSIQFLFLANNVMEHNIPTWIGRLSKLRALDISFNKLTGTIPSDWRNSTLTSLSPKYSDKPPSAIVYNAEGQQYIGYALPTTLDFSHNQLVGSIPPQLGVLRNLQILNLSDNNLQGSIPSSLGDIPALLKLDLSRNNLSGRIPMELAKLTFLSELNLSYNRLHGEVPVSGQFPTFGNLSFVGNPDLCGVPLDRECRSEPKGAGSTLSDVPMSVVRKLLPLYIVLAVSFGFCGFSAFFIVLIRKRHKLGSEEDEYNFKSKMYGINSSEVSTVSEGVVAWISPKELMAATRNYNNANIIGDGGFGIVYKAVLADGSIVAVKKLITDGGFGRQGEREFLAEMQTLGKIKHRNLVSLRGYSCDDNDRILVYKYLKNGSLDTWLHCREEGVKPLDWRTRFGIILGAARGVEFLHHECFPPIVHRDIKASNILLDENFEAHVADFGLARLMREAGDTHVSTDVAGTVGYIPPEYNSACMATMRGDVYSFGVVILETVIGKRPTDASFRRAGGINQIVARNITELQLHSVLDCSMTCEGFLGDVLEVMRIACLCCTEKPGKRPQMRQVVRMLEAVEKKHSSVGIQSVDGGSKHFTNTVEA